METIEPAYGTATLLIIAVGAVLLLLTLILRFRVHAFVALVHEDERAHTRGQEQAP